MFSDPAKAVRLFEVEVQNTVGGRRSDLQTFGVRIHCSSVQASMVFILHRSSSQAAGSIMDSALEGKSATVIHSPAVNKIVNLVYSAEGFKVNLI